MTTESDTNRGSYFVTSVLPWLLAGGMLVIYLLTLNHSISTNNISRISELNGWRSPHRFFSPVTFLITYPLHWLPVALIAPGLKVLAAICAAFSLAFLARSVTLLPHDRTHEQRQRELSEFSFLSIPAAWLAPLFAVLVCGLQMTFWETATNTAVSTPNLLYFGTDATGEMIDLFLFAYCIRCLLEYRLTLKNSWLGRFAFVYGLSMANNWLMIGLFPGFLAALIWILGLRFFNFRLLGLLTVCLLAGLMLIFLLPLQVTLAHLDGYGFWQSLRQVLGSDKFVLSAFPRGTLLLLTLTSILPLFVIGIRWASYFGDTSQLGVFLATFIFHIVHGLFLVACVWVAFDPPFSPRLRGLGMPFLPLYYLGALSIGYFTGYFLLVFGTRPPKARRRPHPLIRLLNFSIVGFIWFLALATPAVLIWKNLPQLRNRQSADAAIARFSSLTAGCLPAQGAVVISDDPVRLLFLQNSMGSKGLKPNNLFINTASITREQYYVRDLGKIHPEFKIGDFFTNTTSVPSVIEIIRLLEKLAEHHDVYYLHPSFGYYFERFYQEPKGLVYKLNRLATNQWKTPRLTGEQITVNQKFWKGVTDDELPIVTHLVEQSKHPVTSPLLRRIMESGHLTVELNESALLLGSYYSHSLDYWGCELQVANHLPEAAKSFEEALQFNPENVSAQVNLAFNEGSRVGKKTVIDEPKLVLDKFGKHRGWTDLLNQDGPFIDPSFCYVLGVALAVGENYGQGGYQTGGGNYVQALQQFDRVYTLAPDFSPAANWVAKLLLVFNNNTEAMAVIEPVLRQNPQDTSALFYKGISLMQQGLYDKAIAPLSQLLVIQTNNYSALLDRGISYLQLSNYPAAKSDYQTLATIVPQAYQVDYGLAEIAYHQKDTNDVIKYTERYLSNYYQSFPANFTPPETDEVKLIKKRLQESKTGTP